MQTASRDIPAADRLKLRDHVVNLRQGRLSTDGDFTTTASNIEAIFTTALPAALEAAQRANRPLHLLFYAHGGLVDEKSGIAGALGQIDFWKANNVYPIFFIWETGFLEVLADILRKRLTGRRGLGDFGKDAVARALEAVARPGGVRVWGNMKLSAQAASAPDGGARLVADRAAAFVKAHASDVQIHAIGHSAGAIFHSFFLPVLVAAGAPVKSLALLAPAVNIPTFRAQLEPLIGNGIAAATMFTMHTEFELDDTAGPYPKSLLYFVRNAFEDPDQTPILGLEESLDADAHTRGVFAGANEIVFSVTAPGASKRAATRAIHHGDFDNDAPTMSSVCRRILGVGDDVAISDFPEARGRAFDPLEQLSQELVAQSAAESARASPAAGGRTGFGAANARVEATPSRPAIAAARGKRLALCIGIDEYAPPNTLAGCVADSQDWERLLLSMDFKVAALRDDAATRGAITAGLETHVSRLKAGDLFVFQYSGHGTQFPDDTGDEPDGQDEAFCPYDMMTAGFIRDDEIRRILNRVPAGALAIGFVDCCHSGSIARMVVRTAGARSLNDSRPRAIEATPEMIEVHRHTRDAGRVVASSTRRDITFAACRDDQVAFETAGHGDYTKLVVPLIKSRARGITNIALQKAIQAEFGAGARQNPVLDCETAAEARPFLEP